MKIPIPTNEAKRLDALSRYRILDTGSEQMFDDVALIASAVCQTPIALMSLIDSERQWFKARVGLDVAETPREHAFCSYTIIGDEPLIVEDATTDPRFANNPLVTSAPHIRFYAGAPLIDREGNALGSLCVIDRKPRQLTDGQKIALAALARGIIRHIELRQASAELARVMEELQTVRSLLPICAHCKGIKNDGGYWQKVEEYISSHTAADLSHGICPGCMKAHYPEIYKRMAAEGKI